MSTASRVPETWELTGDDARATLRRVGRLNLLRDSFLRFRYADGFSHARSMAFLTSLVLVQGAIAVVGVTALLGGNGFKTSIVRAIRDAVPGPAHRVLTDAVTQASHAGHASLWLPIVLGTVGALVSGATLLGQLERALNRLYGIEQDRPTLQKYTLALILAVTAGTCVTAAFVVFAFGNSIGQTLGHDARSVWAVVRWPLALGLVVVGMSLLFRRSPRRHQPAFSWLAYGAGLATLLWSAVTLLLGVMFTASSTFGDTYGPLAGIVALQFWTFFSAVAVLYGAAAAAQLEAVRAGEAVLQDPDKVEDDAVPEPATALADLGMMFAGSSHGPTARTPIDDAGRDETEAERIDRNLTELMEELRVAIIGVQVLFGFLLALPFTTEFSSLDDAQRALYVGDLLLAAFATALLIAPVAHHRLVFRQHAKKRVLYHANALAVVGLATVGAAVSGSVLLVASVVCSAAVAPVIAALTALVFFVLWFVVPKSSARRDDY